MKGKFRIEVLLAAGLLASAPAGMINHAEAPSKVTQDRNAIALEALRRLKDVDLESNPAIKAAVLRIAESVHNTPQFVELVRDFNLEGQEAALLEVALRNHSNGIGADAARLIAESDAGLALLQSNLNSDRGEIAAKTAVLLGNIEDRRAVPLLLDLVTEPDRDLAVRKQAVRALAQTREGATELMALARMDKLPASVKLAASMALNRTRWPEIAQSAAELLPLPQAGDAEPLPGIDELVTRNGNPQKGAEVFASATVACDRCHQVRGQGVDFGPKLSEIGAKLGKDALYEAILDPTAGISFGFEGWQIEFKDGDETAGIVVSETPDELAVKAQTGIVSQYKKSNILRRIPMRTSLMPSGLQQAMSVQDLVDLVEYLASLKKEP